MIIPFRSRFNSSNNYGLSKNQKNINQSEISHLAPYNQNSDSRNIFWKKWANEFSIFEKKYNDFSEFSLIFCIISENGDNFYHEENKKTRKQWKIDSLFHLEHSAKNLNISYKILKYNNSSLCLQELLKRKTLNKLIIFISNSEIQENYNILKKISQINEIIWIKPYHSFELNPNNKSLFLGKIFQEKNKQKYLDELNLLDKNNKNSLAKLKIPFITTTTNIPINQTLYHFFKYQYE